jgi:3-deoxy-manno-octulosonate cytidylyltransferase (CMP-KDO synthetase)
LAAIVVIPARYDSTRFPAKILAARTGRPLVQHVVDQVRRCQRVSQVIVATDDVRIVEALRRFDTHCLMTSASHVSGTDRVAEVAAGRSEEIIVNVQGDEPEIEPGVVDALIDRLESGDSKMATAATPFPAWADPGDPNLVKVVLDQSGRAIYFSRCPIPYDRDGTVPSPGIPGEGKGGGASAGRAATQPPNTVVAHRPYLLHLGIYAYRREFLLRFARLAPTPLEKAEKLEQLRALEHGQAIEVLRVERSAHGIDTPEQYQAFVDRYNRDGSQTRTP